MNLEPSAIERILNDLDRQNWEVVSYVFADHGQLDLQCLSGKAADRDVAGRARPTQNTDKILMETRRSLRRWVKCSGHWLSPMA